MNHGTSTDTTDAAVQPDAGGSGMTLETPCARIRTLTLALLSLAIRSKLELPSALSTCGTSAASEAENLVRCSLLVNRHW